MYTYSPQKPQKSTSYIRQVKEIKPYKLSDYDGILDETQVDDKTLKTIDPRENIGQYQSKGYRLLRPSVANQSIENLETERRQVNLNAYSNQILNYQQSLAPSSLLINKEQKSNIAADIDVLHSPNRSQFQHMKVGQSTAHTQSKNIQSIINHSDIKHELNTSNAFSNAFSNSTQSKPSTSIMKRVRQSLNYQHARHNKNNDKQLVNSGGDKRSNKNAALIDIGKEKEIANQMVSLKSPNQTKVYNETIEFNEKLLNQTQDFINQIFSERKVMSKKNFEKFLQSQDKFLQEKCVKREQALKQSLENELGVNKHKMKNSIAYLQRSSRNKPEDIKTKLEHAETHQSNIHERLFNQSKIRKSKERQESQEKPINQYFRTAAQQKEYLQKLSKPSEQRLSRSPEKNSQIDNIQYMIDLKRFRELMKFMGFVKRDQVINSEYRLVDDIWNSYLQRSEKQEFSDLRSVIIAIAGVMNLRNSQMMVDNISTKRKDQRFCFNDPKIFKFRNLQEIEVFHDKYKSLHDRKKLTKERGKSTENNNTLEFRPSINKKSESIMSRLKSNSKSRLLGDQSNNQGQAVTINKINNQDLDQTTTDVQRKTKMSYLFQREVVSDGNKFFLTQDPSSSSTKNLFKTYEVTNDINADSEYNTQNNENPFSKTIDIGKESIKAYSMIEHMLKKSIRQQFNPLMVIDVNLGGEKGMQKIEIYDIEEAENTTLQFAQIHEIKPERASQLVQLVKQKVEAYLASQNKQQ
eukprot:403337917